MVARKLLGVIGIFLVANYAAVNGRCLKASTGGRPRCLPYTWSQWRDKCYKMHDAVVTWEEGKLVVMVVPQSEEELQHLLNMYSCTVFWIGCNDIEVEGTWVCLDGDGTIDVQDNRWNAEKDQPDGTIDVQDKIWNAEKDQPDNNGGNQDCAVGCASGWRDVNCDHIRKLICQRLVTPAQ